MSNGSELCALPFRHQFYPVFVGRKAKVLPGPPMRILMHPVDKTVTYDEYPGRSHGSKHDIKSTKAKIEIM